MWAIAGAEVFGDPFDRAALARGVAALENHHHAGAGMPHPLLQLHEFGLQPEQFGFVDFVGDLGLRAGGSTFFFFGFADAPSFIAVLIATDVISKQRF